MRLGLSLVLFALGCGSSASSINPAEVDASIDTGTIGDVAPEHVHETDVSIDAGEYDGPSTLAETGLYSDFASKTLSPAAIPYDVRYPLWSDSLDKSRFISIPAGTTIDTSDPDHWQLPIGAKIWKEFRVGTRRLETRYLEKRADGWLRVTFGWDATESSAIAMPAGATAYGGTTHDLPDRETCDRCHLGQPEGVLGIGTIQLSPLLDDFRARGLLSKPVAPKDPPGTGLTQEVLAYFHGNCGFCHNSVGAWAKANELRLTLHVKDDTPELTGAYTTTIDRDAHHMVTGIPTKIVVAGDPDASQLFYRMNRRDDWQMPPAGTNKVDTTAVAKVRDWITALK